MLRSQAGETQEKSPLHFKSCTSASSAICLKSQQAPLVTIFFDHAGSILRAPLAKRQLQQALETMCATIANSGKTIGDIELYLLRDASLAKVNSSQLGCNGPTNVLSFPGGFDMAGTLLISVDALERECILYRQKPKKHLLRLLAHGMGHLAGFEHGPDMDVLCAACMQTAENRLDL